MIKGIAFDLQFTLVFLEKFTLLKWFKLFDEGFKRVLEYLEAKDIKVEPKKIKRTLSRIRNKYFALTITEDQQYFTEEILRDTFSKTGISLPPNDLSHCVELYHSIEIPAWKPAPKVHTTLTQLKEDYNLAIITNASQFVTDGILSRTQLDQYFDFIYTKARKPRFPAFQQFKEAMNTEYEELAMVGDDIRADIEPAIALGMKTIHIYRGYEYLTHHAQTDICPDIKLSKFENLIGALKDLK